MWCCPDIWSWWCCRRLSEFSPRYNLPVGFYGVVCLFGRKYLSNRIKFILNSEPLSKITLRGPGYLESHTSSNILDILAKGWSMIGNYSISNHTVSRQIKVVHNILSYFVKILFSGCLTLSSMVYVIMRYIHTVCHGVNVLASLAWINP